MPTTIEGVGRKLDAILKLVQQCDTNIGLIVGEMRVQRAQIDALEQSRNLHASKIDNLELRVSIMEARE